MKDFRHEYIRNELIKGEYCDCGLEKNSIWHQAKGVQPLEEEPLRDKIVQIVVRGEEAVIYGLSESGVLYKKDSVAIKRNSNMQTTYEDCWIKELVSPLLPVTEEK